MSSSDELLDELLARPVGPTMAPKTKKIEDFQSEVSISKTTAEVEVRAGKDEASTLDTALRYLQEEGQNPSEWEVTHFRKIKYGMGLESVRFSFRKIVTALDDESISPEVVQSWRSALQVAERVALGEVSGGGAYVILVADPQLGKKGTDEAVENYRRGVAGHVDAVRNLGSAVSSVHVAWMGDETENVVNSYGNQPHTVVLNRSQQLELDYDLRVASLKQVLALGLPTSASSVISNHGEWTRNGGKEPVTTQSDNASTFIARQTKSLFDELEPFTGQGVEWYIDSSAGHPGLTITLADTECYFSHGYIEKGRGGSTEIRTRNAIERQILGRTDELGKTKLWYMAHYHHLYFQEFEGRTLFGCPALEAERSSEYMLDQFGVWSPPGMLGMLVDPTASRGWSNLNVF